MLNKLNIPLRLISFAAILLSSALPRPLDWVFLLLSILTGLASGWKNYYSSLKENLKLKTFTISYLSLFSFFMIIHGFTITISYFSQDGIVIFLLAFIHLIALLGSIDIKTKARFIKLFYLLANLISVVAIFQFFGFLSTTAMSISEIYFSAPIYRTTAFLPHATSLTIWLISALVFLFLTTPQSYVKLMLHTLTTALCLIALATTQGRTGLLVCILIICLLMLKNAVNSFSNKINLKHLLKIIGFAFGLAILTFTIYNFSKDSTTNRFTDFFNIKAKHSQRLQENYLGKEILLQYPLGTGPEHIASIAKEIRSKDQFFQNQSWIFTEWRGIHNGFLQYSSIWGWPGLILLLLCLFIPVFLKKNAKKQLYFLSIGLSIYFLSDNIFYREISSVFAICFSGVLFLNNTDDSGSELKTSKRMNIAYLLTSLVLCVLVTKLVNLRTLQINNNPVVSLAIDNPSDSPHTIYINNNKVRNLENNNYTILFFKPNTLNLVKLKNEIDGTNFSFDFNKKLDFFNVQSFWLTTMSEQSYSLLTFTKNQQTGLFEEKITEYMRSEAFTLYEVPREVIKANTYFNEESIADFKYLNKIDKQPVLIRSGFKRDGIYRCYEPAQYIKEAGLFYDPCLREKNNNYSVKAIKMVFKNLWNKNGQQ